MSGYQSGSASIGTIATLIASVGSAPDTDSLLIKNTGSTTVYVGGSAVTTASFPVASTDGAVTIPTTGAESLSLCRITSSGTASVVYLPWLTETTLGTEMPGARAQLRAALDRALDDEPGRPRGEPGGAQPV
jgi:hypothetical protein